MIQWCHLFADGAAGEAHPPPARYALVVDETQKLTLPLIPSWMPPYGAVERFEMSRMALGTEFVVLSQKANVTFGRPSSCVRIPATLAYRPVPNDPAIPT